MKHSYLIQRLQKPAKSSFAGLGPDNPFAFGGGYKNGGLSDEAMSLIRPIFSFDYMGAAEYEFGAVPEGLNKVAQKAHKRTLVAGTVEVPLASVPKSWRDKSKKAPEGTGTVYFLCGKDESDEVMTRITAWATDPMGDKFRTRDMVSLDRSLRPFDEWDSQNCGWLELENGFMFFTDEEMFKQTAELFGVKVDE